jgi:hypothetical protein
MDRNPYDASIDWLQQSPVNKQESVYTARQQGSPQPQTPNAPKKVAPAKQPRMPKQKAVELVSSLKKGIVVSSVMSFGLISLLATGHAVGTTTSTTTTKTPVTSSSSTATATPSIASTATATATPAKTSTATATPAKTSTSSSSKSASFGTSSSQGSVSGTSVS